MELVATRNPDLRDAQGKYLQRLEISNEPSLGGSPRLLNHRVTIAYRDLALPPGSHPLSFQIRIARTGALPLLATSDVVFVTVSAAQRIITAVPAAGDLERWQIPASFAIQPQTFTDPTTRAARTIAGGFESQMNDARQRLSYAETDFAEIHFATNRAANTSLTSTTRADFFFNAVPSSLSFGHCRVQVLRRTYEQEKAARQRPLSFGELQNYFTVLETRFATPPEFAALLSKDDVLLYIHGYDNTFEDALLRAAQLHLDLEFPGQTIAFCWPSLGKDVIYENDDPEQGRLAYRDDLAAADASVAALIETLQSLQAAASPGRRIHVVAHSMGNRILLRALQEMAHSTAAPLIDQLVLAAPDVAVTELAAAAPALAALARRTTLYCSQKDVALLVSSRIHALLDAALSLRAGGVVRCYPHCDAISANLVNSYFAMNGGHCYFAEAPQMVQDLHLLICRQLPAEQRPTLLSRMCNVEEDRSWELHP
jgi:esterase/lipase superfamily enzyme